MTTRETAADFLSERRDFLHVYATRSVSGYAWDVVLRLDGTYAERADAEAVAVGIRDWIDGLADVRLDGGIWWDGCPAHRDRP